MTTLASQIASLVAARLNCIASNRTEWRDKHEDEAEKLVREHMPSGSGFDNGTTLDFDASTEDKLVFATSFHHVDDNGSYCGWTEHTVTVLPAFDGITIKVSGRDRNDIKGYIAEQFHYALTQKRAVVVGAE